MRVLILGGTRFLGAEIAARLVAGGRRVTLLNRGTCEGPLGARVERLVVDRTVPGALAKALDGRTFDAAVDMCAYTASDAIDATLALGGRVGHYIFASTGQVYLVREGYTWPAREWDFDGPTTAPPDDPNALGEWRYGMDKRAAEDVLAAAWKRGRFPSTRLRLPMVHGLRDCHRRIEGYVWRALDGGPILLPDGGTGPARQVASTAVARAVCAMLGDARTFGRAYNLAWDEATTVRELVSAITRAAGASPDLVAVSRAQLAQVGVSDVDASPLGGAWMSCLDPTRAKVELGFVHEPLRPWLDATVAAVLADLPREPPPGYARRADELRLARGE